MRLCDAQAAYIKARYPIGCEVKDAHPECNDRAIIADHDFESQSWCNGDSNIYYESNRGIVVRIRFENYWAKVVSDSSPSSPLLSLFKTLNYDKS